MDDLLQVGQQNFLDDNNYWILTCFDLNLIHIFYLTKV
jgi:hypothetical protein